MNGKHKIVFILNTLAGGGIARVVTTFANHIAQLGEHEVFLLVMHNKPSLYELHPQIKLMQNKAQRKPGGKFSYVLNSIGFIRKCVKNIGECTVIVNGEWLNSFAYLCLRGLVKKIYLADHSNPQRSGQSPFPWVDRYVYPRVKGVLVLSEAAKQKVAKQYGQKNILLLDNPVLFPKPLAIQRRDVVLCMGRLSPEKGQDMLIKAFAQTNNHWQLWFLGDGPIRAELEELAKADGIADRVVFLGMQQNTALYLNQAGIYVMPSLTENFPMALIEAMSLGLPCIATDCMQWRKDEDFIKDGINGIKVAVGHPEKLAVAIDTLIANEELRISLGEKAANIKHQFDIDKTVKKFIEYVI